MCININEKTIDRIGQFTLLIISSLFIFVTANDQSLWVDEVATVSHSDPRFGLSYSEVPPQMPLVYILVFMSRVLFGSNEMAYRLPLILISFGMINAIPWVLKREGIDTTTAWLAPYLMLLLPKFIYYSQEVRAWMPMAACVFFWGVLREQRGWKGWIVCSIALQSNTFAIVYIVMVVAVDWIHCLWKKTEHPSLSPVIAILTHIPSLVFILYQNRHSNLPIVQDNGVMLNELFSRLLNFTNTTNYIYGSFKYFFNNPDWIWIVIFVFSVICVIWKSTPFKRFWIGIAFGTIASAIALKSTGWHAEPRYLIMILPLVCIAPFLFPWKKGTLSIIVALVIIFIPHLTPLSFDIRETIHKADRTYKSKPWRGVLPQLFQRTSHSLIHKSRHDWRHLTLLLDAIVPLGETILFKWCGSCYFHPFMFYDREFAKKYDIQRAEDDRQCAKWIISTHELVTDELRCGLALIGRLDRFYVYGKKDIVIRKPILYSRYLE